MRVQPRECLCVCLIHTHTHTCLAAIIHALPHPSHLATHYLSVHPDYGLCAFAIKSAKFNLVLLFVG